MTLALEVHFLKNILVNLIHVLKRCQKTNLVLNLEKCHVMVQEGIVLGYKVSNKSIEDINAFYFPHFYR